MHIYLATAAVNPYTASITRKLRDLGHTFYHFMEGDNLLDYELVHPNLTHETPMTQAAATSHPKVVEACSVNLNAILKTDAFILADPANKGCYTEFGIATAWRKPTLLIVTDEYNIGVMDAVFKYAITLRNFLELANIDFLTRVK